MLQKREDRLFILTAIVAWICCLIIVYSKVLFGGQVLTYSNIMYASLPWGYEGVSVSGAGLSDPIDVELPKIYRYFHDFNYSSWVRNISFGTPSSFEVVWYPLNILYLLPVQYAILIKSIVEFSIAYFGMIGFLKQLKLHNVAAIFGGISYSLSSAMVMWHFWQHTDVMMLAPIALLLGDRIIHKVKLKYILLLSLVVYLMIIAGMPTYAAYVLYLLAFYVLYQTIYTHRSNFKEIATSYIGFGIAVVISILAILPYAHSIISSTVTNGYAGSRADISVDTLPLFYLRTLLFPYERAGIELHPNESTLYFGLGAIILLPFTFFRITKKKNYYWPVSTIFLTLMCYTPALDFIFTKIPVINTSLKYRMISVLALSAVVTVSINLSDVLNNTKLYREKIWRFFIYGTLWALYVYLYIKYPDSVIYAVVIAAIPVLIELYIYVGNKMVRIIVQVALIVISALSMGIFTENYFPYIPAGTDVVPEPTVSIRFLQENCEDARYYALDSWTLFPNTNVFYGINSITSHSFLNTNPDVTNFLSTLDARSMLTKTAYHGFQIDNYNLLRYAGGKYIVRHFNAVFLPDDTVCSMVQCGEDGIIIYEMDSYAPFYFLSTQAIVMDEEEDVFEAMCNSYEDGVIYTTNDEAAQTFDGGLESNEGIIIIEDNEDQIELEVNVNNPRVLVFNEYHDPDWKVKIDGQEAEFFTVNYLFNGVIIPAGDHEVELVYNNDIEDKLAIISYIDIALAVLCYPTVVLIKYTKKNKGAKAV